MSRNVVWISEEEALKSLGLDKPETLRRLIGNGRLKIAWSQITRKAKRLYNKSDVELALLQHSTIVT
jgi:hypothetical protein